MSNPTSMQMFGSAVHNELVSGFLFDSDPEPYSSYPQPQEPVEDSSKDDDNQSTSIEGN